MKYPLSSAVSVRMLLSSPAAAFRIKQCLFQSAASTAALPAGVKQRAEHRGRIRTGQEGLDGPAPSTMDGGGTLKTLLSVPGHMEEEMTLLLRRFLTL